MNTAAQSELLSLAGRTALITGGASGMGQTAAFLFAAHGAHVAILDRNGAAAKETAAQIKADGGTADAYEVELADHAAVDAFLTTFKAKYDVLDVLFNHAGLPGPPGLTFDPASWMNCMTINVYVPMVFVRELLPLLRKSASASIICTSSIAGLMAVPGLPTYAASKAALNQFVKSVAIELAPEGIRANTICPGATDTPALRRDLEDGTVSGSLEAVAKTVPMRRLGTPEDIANMALFLASDASKFVTGQAIPVDGGATA
jgi:3-oxoacyl-[acyl-carrier protein] reductase